MFYGELKSRSLVRMQLLLVVSVLLVLPSGLRLANSRQVELPDDNDFAEFEESDDDEFDTGSVSSAGDDQQVKPPAVKVVMSPEAAAAAAAAAAQNADVVDDDDDVTVEDDEEDFEHLSDEDEFEGFDKERTPKKSHEQPPDLKITKVPIHLHTNWDSFYMEMLMLGGLVAYLLNFLAGRNKNSRLAQSWLATHRQLLEDNFSIIGDDGTSTEVQSSAGLMKEAENIYALWCTGRTYCEGMLVTLKLLKRQDLISSIARFMRPVCDQIIIKVILDDSEFESFVFCLAHKRVSASLLKDHQDLSSYCVEKKSAEKFGLSSNFQILSENPEITACVLDTKVVTAIQKLESMVEYLHFSDQYTGARQPEENQAGKIPETKRVMIFCFNLVDGAGSSCLRDMNQMKPLMKMVFYCIDKIKRLKLSKETKLKAERSRQKTVETLQKAAHSQRTEAAQNRREEKRRAEKERMMNEDDPDKQRKLEEKTLKKEAKKKQPKLKRMKIKAL